jgi:hypothetical protein
MKTLNELFYHVILLNELDGNLNAALRFSDPDGVLSGKSGWSFGVCQFDTKNNDQALACLRECGFTAQQIKGIVDQSLPVAHVRLLEPKLQANAEIIERYSTNQLSYCLNKALNFNSDYGIPVADSAAILAGADYCNQYGSEGNGARAYYKALARPITAEDVLQFKLSQTQYGREHPKDCQRRYDNLMKVVREMEVKA